MFKIKTLNEISPVYKSILTEAEYSVSKEETAPDAIIVRSADMPQYGARNADPYFRYKSYTSTITSRASSVEKMGLWAH